MNNFVQFAVNPRRETYFSADRRPTDQCCWALVDNLRGRQSVPSRQKAPLATSGDSQLQTLKLLFRG
jgi:hypothetical protein